MHRLVVLAVVAAALAASVSGTAWGSPVDGARWQQGDGARWGAEQVGGSH